MVITGLLESLGAMMKFLRAHSAVSIFMNALKVNPAGSQGAAKLAQLQPHTIQSCSLCGRDDSVTCVGKLRQLFRLAMLGNRFFQTPQGYVQKRLGSRFVPSPSACLAFRPICYYSNLFQHRQRCNLRNFWRLVLFRNDYPGGHLQWVVVLCYWISNA